MMSLRRRACRSSELVWRSEGTRTNVFVFGVLYMEIVAQLLHVWILASANIAARATAQLIFNSYVREAVGSDCLNNSA